MKLKDCLDIGLNCGMSTVTDCVANVQIHAMNIFVYSKISEELKELNSELSSLIRQNHLTLDTSTGDALKILRELNKED